MGAEEKKFDWNNAISGLNKESKENIIMKQLEIREKELKRGAFDKVFGSINTKIYIATIISIFLIFTGIIINVINHTSELWNIILPLIGTVCGYVFGKEFTNES